LNKKICCPNCGESHYVSLPPEGPWVTGDLKCLACGFRFQADYWDEMPVAILFFFGEEDEEKDR